MNECVTNVSIVIHNHKPEPEQNEKRFKQTHSHKIKENKFINQIKIHSAPVDSFIFVFLWIWTIHISFQYSNVP